MIEQGSKYIMYHIELEQEAGYDQEALIADLKKLGRFARDLEIKGNRINCKIEAYIQLKDSEELDQKVKGGLASYVEKHGIRYICNSSAKIMRTS